MIYHDFTRQYNYKRHGNLDLSADSDSIEFKLLERENSAAVAKERKIVKGYSGTHGLMMRLRNFRTDVADFDLKAKTRKVEKLAIAILDKTEKEPELAYKTSKLTNVYLPTLCRTMENYLEAIKSGESKQANQKRLSDLHETLDISTAAFIKMNDNLCKSSKDESEINLKVMKEMMQKDGLI